MNINDKFSPIRMEYQLKKEEYQEINFTLISNVTIAPKEVIVVDKFKPFIWIAFDFEDQWKARNDKFLDSLFDSFAHAFAPTDYDAMQIKKRSEQRKYERIVTTHFEPLISLS